MAVASGVYLLIGMGLSFAAITIKDLISTNKYPFHQIILKEVGGTMPKPIYTRVRKEGNWYIGKNKVITPIVTWKNMISDMLLLSYFKSESNIYPCLIERQHTLAKSSTFPFFSIVKKPSTAKVKVNEEKSGETKTELTDVGIRVGSKIEPAKVHEDDKTGDITLVSEHYACIFPGEPANLVPIVDDTIKDVTVDLWKANAERYSSQDWLSKWGPLLGQGVFIIAMVLVFMMMSKAITASKEMAKEPVRIAIENAINTVAKTVATPPPEYPPGFAP